MTKKQIREALEEIPRLKGYIRDLTSRIAFAYEHGCNISPRYGAVCSHGNRHEDRIAEAVVTVTVLKDRRKSMMRMLARRYRLIDSIPDPLIRDAVVRHYLRDESWEEIAESAGMSGGGLRMKVQRYLDIQENASSRSK